MAYVVQDVCINWPRYSRCFWFNGIFISSIKYYASRIDSLCKAFSFVPYGSVCYPHNAASWSRAQMAPQWRETIRSDSHWQSLRWDFIMSRCRNWYWVYGLGTIREHVDRLWPRSVPSGLWLYFWRPNLGPRPLVLTYRMWVAAEVNKGLIPMVLRCFQIDATRYAWSSERQQRTCNSYGSFFDVETAHTGRPISWDQLRNSHGAVHCSIALHGARTIHKRSNTSLELIDRS